MSDQNNETAPELAPADTLSSPGPTDQRGSSEGQPTAPSVGEDMAGRVAAAEAEAAALKDKLLRALAETENVRRRGEREREDTAKFAIRKFAGDLLNVSDNLRRALEAVPAEQIADPNLKNLLGGIEATERELIAAFDRAGIKPVKAQGAAFDPNCTRRSSSWWPTTCRRARWSRCSRMAGRSTTGCCGRPGSASRRPRPSASGSSTRKRDARAGPKAVSGCSGNGCRPRKPPYMRQASRSGRR